MVKAILTIMFQVLFVIPLIWVCKWFYKLLLVGFQMGAYMVFGMGKLVIKDPDEFMTFQDMKMTKVISELIGFAILIAPVVIFIKFIWL